MGAFLFFCYTILMKMIKENPWLFIGLFLSIFLFILSCLAIPISSTDNKMNHVFKIVPEKKEEIKKREKVPEKPINAIYLTAYSAGNPNKIDSIIEQMKNSQINGVIIDIKDYSGYLSYDSNIEMVNSLDLEQVKIKDLAGVLKKFHDNNFYTIARIAVFQDPRLSNLKNDWAVQNKNTGTIWKDNKGLSWLDPSNPEVWQYHVDIAKEVVGIGFDEVNLDYVRFPSDGPISAMSFPKWQEQGSKADVIRDFFAYFSDKMKDEPAYISADLFGMTTTVTNDMNIGQLLENATPYFDYICPMVYPSHYPDGYLGLADPAAHPYELIFNDISVANTRLSTSSKAKIRPWIQDFNLGAIYDENMIRKELEANTDAGGYGYLVWDPKNIYTFAAYK